MNNLENMIEIARNLACEALTETNCFAKLKLLVESANQYYLASQNADEPGVKVSLAYLAAFKVSEANLLKTTMISTDHKSHQLRNLNDTAPKEAITFGNRLLFEAHSRRISGLSKVPRPRIISSEDVVKDLLLMEKQLEEIGFFKQSQEYLKTGVGESKHLSSDLGESFMLLSNHQYASNSKSSKPASTETNHPESLSTAKSNNVKFKGSRNVSSSATAGLQRGRTVDVPHDETYLGKSIILSENRTTLSAQHPYADELQQSNLLTCNNVGSDKAAKLSKQQQQQFTAQQKVTDQIEWNSKSTVLPAKPLSQIEVHTAKSQSSKTHSSLPPSKATIMNDIPSTVSDSAAKSLRQSLDSTPASKPRIEEDDENVLRLLKLLETLNDENVVLLDEKERVLQEMASFKEEYKAKFMYMKRYLQQFPLQSAAAPGGGTLDFSKQGGGGAHGLNNNNGSNHNNSLPSTRELELMKQSTYWKQIAESYENKYRKMVEENNSKSVLLDEYATFFQEVKKRKEQQQQQQLSQTSVTGTSNRPTTATFSSSSSSTAHSNKSTVPQKTPSYAPPIPQPNNTRSALNHSHNSTSNGGSSNSTNTTTTTVQSMNIATMQAQLRRQKQHHTTSTLQSLLFEDIPTTK